MISKEKVVRTYKMIERGLIIISLLRAPTKISSYDPGLVLCQMGKTKMIRAIRMPLCKVNPLLSGWQMCISVHLPGLNSCASDVLHPSRARASANKLISLCTESLGHSFPALISRSCRKPFNDWYLNFRTLIDAFDSDIKRNKKTVFCLFGCVCSDIPFTLFGFLKKLIRVCDWIKLFLKQFDSNRKRGYCLFGFDLKHRGVSYVRRCWICLEIGWENVFMLYYFMKPFSGNLNWSV